VLAPVEETGMTPQKIYTSTSDFEDINQVNWSIIAVSKIPVLQLCLFRTVTTCHRQFSRNDTFGDESKLQDAINVKVQGDYRGSMSLASH
jgi:hypothetical protein